MTAFVIFAAILCSMIALSVVHKRMQAAREAWLDAYAFPDGVRRKVAKTYPHLTAEQVDLVCGALRDWFQLSRKAGRRMLAMPSQAVDVAWHEFILFTRNYQEFCRRALGRFLHHTPAEAMRTPTQASDAMRRTWRLACLRAGMDPKAATALPLLFSLDTQLAIPDGFRYELDCMHKNAAVAAGGTAGVTYCGSHIGCGGGCGGGCAGSGCGGDGGCGGGGGD